MTAHIVLRCGYKRRRPPITPLAGLSPNRKIISTRFFPVSYGFLWVPCFGDITLVYLLLTLRENYLCQMFLGSTDA